MKQFRKVLEMAKKSRETLIRTLQKAIANDPRTLYKLSQLAELPYCVPHQFMAGMRQNITLRTASALCDVLGLELRPKRKGGK